jgi:hypothetical protein
MLEDSSISFLGFKFVERGLARHERGVANLGEKVMQSQAFVRFCSLIASVRPPILGFKR